jgi:hypothetical protein
MNNKTLVRTFSLLAPVMVALAITAAPRDAHAQFRAGAYLGY